MFDQTITDFRDLDFSYNDNSIWFDYAALSYSAPEKVAYEYRLRPIDSEWIPTDLRSARYAGLPAGDYTFEVRGRNNDGNWSEHPAKLAFTIRPPVYSTWWFRLILLAGFLAVAFVCNYYRVNKQVELERMRVRIASDLRRCRGVAHRDCPTDRLLASVVHPRQYPHALAEYWETSRRIVTHGRHRLVDRARNDTVGDLTDRMQDYARNILT